MKPWHALFVALLAGCGQDAANLMSFESTLPFDLVIDSRADPVLVPGGPGAGEWNSESPTTMNQLLKPAAVSYLRSQEAIDEHGPDATAALLHYFRNSGEDFSLDVDRMQVDVASFAETWESLLPALRQRLETEQAGDYVFTSANTAASSISRGESENWYLAVAGFQYFVKGEVATTGEGRVATIELHVWDRYDWDPGVVVPINTPFGTIDIDQDRIGEFHRQGLAQEFDSRGFQAIVTTLSL